MAHPRQLIREAVKAALVGQTAAGARVYETRMKPHRKTELPALAVYTLDESVDVEQTSAPRELSRTLQLAVEGAVTGTADVDDTLDALALQVETALHADPGLGGACDDSMLASTEVDVVEDGEKTVGLVRLTYSVFYHTFAPEETEGLDDFTTANIKTSVGDAVHPDDQTEDSVTLPE